MTRASLMLCAVIVMPAVSAVWTSQDKNEIVPAPVAPVALLAPVAPVAPVAPLAPPTVALVPTASAPPRPRDNPRALRNSRLQPRQRVPQMLTGLPPSEGRPLDLKPIATRGLVPPNLVGLLPREGGPSVTAETAVRALLERYRDAYERLDAAAASQAWPSVNHQALTRAFADLGSQSLKFDSCQIDVADTLGVASCRGRSTYVARAGSRTAYSREGEWIFGLRKTGGEWQIDTVRSR